VTDKLPEVCWSYTVELFSFLFVTRLLLIYKFYDDLNAYTATWAIADQDALCPLHHFEWPEHSPRGSVIDDPTSGEHFTVGKLHFIAFFLQFLESQCMVTLFFCSCMLVFAVNEVLLR
jgi:hypothetical protein